MPTISLPRPLITVLQSVVAPDDARPVLAGFNLIHNEGTIAIYAADGHIASRIIFETENTELDKLDIILEARPMFNVAKAIARHIGVDIRYEGKGRSTDEWFFGSYLARTWAQTRPVDGKFPDMASMFAGYDEGAYAEEDYGIDHLYLARIARMAKSLGCRGVIFKPMGRARAAIVDYPLSETGARITTAVMPLVYSERS